ncbi:RNA methyltransferase [Alcaligenaceae bacterium LF4-65]|uniref:tRNA (cytidine/uridine-2'-O-)-methyltransferase TrmJ n=1 Tax=Zwartia hollandica TaxID=324606 RepID=A0A953NB43_9BURK|nr:RNA methyltransferase [Zwartia hollandica]MBZ1351253.1 RNA methyltransferase [Zwartia hollandica]
MTPDFSRVRFVMTEPSHPGNVGSAARAIKTMGFDDLVLVSPKTEQITTQPEAIALASGASDVLAAALTVNSLQEALAPITLAFALTARDRELGPPACDIREAAHLTQAHLAQHPNARVALVVGTERSGLTNEHIELCHRVCHIPANPAYSSLNVSQALQLGAWELRYALLNAQTAPNALSASLTNNRTSKDRGGQPASSQAVQALLTHWQEALEVVGFLDPEHPKKLMPRMRHLFNRGDLTQDEVDMWRGVCTAMIATARGTKQGNPSH